MEWWIPQYGHLAWMLLAIGLIAYLGSPRHRGEIAFRRVRRLLSHTMDSHKSTQFHGLWIPTGGGRKRIDHVVVSQSGVLVIRSIDRSGEISGGEFQELWAERRWGRTRHWPNPVHQGKLQIEALQALLGIPLDCFRLLVVINGSDKLPANLPHQVISVNRLDAAVRLPAPTRLTPSQADDVVARLSQKRLPDSGLSRTAVAQLALAILVAAGIYVVFGHTLASAMRDFEERLRQPAAEEQGAEQRRAQYEESLACAWSSDTQRCACYEPGGEKAEIESTRCRELAQRGSILER